MEPAYINPGPQHQSPDDDERNSPCLNIFPLPIPSCKSLLTDILSMYTVFNTILLQFNRITSACCQKVLRPYRRGFLPGKCVSGLLQAR